MFINSACKEYLQLDLGTLRTMNLVNLVVSGQAIFYAIRERRRLWSSRPSRIVLASSLADLLIVPTLAFSGILMAPLSLSIILALFAAALVFAFALDEVKTRVFHALDMRQ